MIARNICHHVVPSSISNLMVITADPKKKSPSWHMLLFTRIVHMLV
jgi:hypothetical protein